MPESEVKIDSPYPALVEALAQVPRAACGVYLFKEGDGRVLYVGKAVNLKNRLGSYLKTPERHDPKTALMLKKAARVDFLLTTTEREALILERNLIKEHRPRFNVMLRDDKNFLCLRLDLQEDFPALRFVRRFNPDGALYFGPYSSAHMARETWKFMKRAFGLRACKERRLAPRSRPCLEYQVGQCLGPCAGMVAPEAYRLAAQEAALFLKGRGRNVLQNLKAQMAAAAREMEFEKAAALRDRINAIAHTLERQDMARPNFQDRDVLGMAQDAGRALVLVLQVRGGLVTGSREYYFSELLPGNDLLGAFLKQYYTEDRPLPDEILLPQDPPERRLLQEVLSEQRGKPVHLRAVKGMEPSAPEATAPTRHSPPAGQSERGRLLALAGENARASLQRRREKIQPEEALANLQELLQLPQPPRRLECLDISTLQGEQPVGALVAFADGAPDKSGYRRFRIREVAGQDDYAMLGEVVRRHYGKEGQTLPDLLVVDGGRGQLQVVLQALKEVGQGDLPVVALAKAIRQGFVELRDRLFLPGRKNPRFFPAAAPGWLLLLRLRDEAHRFAVTYHRKRARKEMVESVLDKIPGIGPVRRKRLLQHFPNIAALKAASLEELAAVPGLNHKVAEKLKACLAGEGREGLGARGQ